MEENKPIKIGLTTMFLLLLIIVIIIMGFIIYKMYNEKVSAESKVSELNKQVSSLEDTTSTLQQKINIISDTINFEKTNTNNSSSNKEENNSTQKVLLNEKYNNSDYGITFSYPSSFSEHKDSLKEDAVESFLDNSNNQIVITRKNNSSIDKEIDFIKNTTTPDGSKFNTNIKEDGYIELNSGAKGYKMQMTSGGYDNIKFITEKNDIVFCFSFTIGNNSDKDKYTEIFEEIIKSVSIK